MWRASRMRYVSLEGLACQGAKNPAHKEPGGLSE